MQHKQTASHSRRQLLKLAAASLLLVSGCASFRQGSNLDTAMSDLSELLDDMADNEEQAKLAAIARRIEIRAQELAAEHREFVNNFDRLLTQYDATEAQLKQLIETHAINRVSKRNDLLHLQDELHSAMTPDEWARVVQVLNEAGNELAGYSLAEI